MITKSYAKNGQSCRVTFQLLPASGARSAAVVGEFNDWRPEAHPMERAADGSFRLTVSLPAGRRYRFRYLIDGEGWANDEGADSYVLNQFGSQDAVLDLAGGAIAPAAHPATNGGSTAAAAKAPREAAPKPARTGKPAAAAAAPGGTAAAQPRKTANAPAAAKTKTAAAKAAPVKAPAAKPVPKPAAPPAGRAARPRRTPDAQ